MAGEKNSGGRTGWNRWIAVLLVLALAPVAIGFNARLATIRQMREDEARLSRQVSVEQARQADLVALRSYIASEAYVEHWARVQARMVKSGEVAVIPVAPTSVLASGTPSSSAGAPKEMTVLDEWWAIFFDADAQASPPSSQ